MKAITYATRSRHARPAASAGSQAFRLASCLLMVLILAWPPDAAAQESLVRNAPLEVPGVVTDALHAPALLEKGVFGARLNLAATDDTDILRDWLRSEGYLDAEVKADFDDQGEVFFEVEAGALWHIEAVDVSPSPPPLSALPEAGQSFRSETYALGKTALRGHWVDEGFLQADFAEAQVIPDHTTKTVRIVWQLEPGPLFQASEIRVEGAQQYDTELARRLSLITSGVVPTRLVIRDGIRNISRDARYKSAAIMPMLDEATENLVPIRIEVTEAARRVLTGEIGYSSDTGLNLGATWTDRGLVKGNLEYGIHGLWSRDTSGAGITASRPSWPGLRDHVGADLDFLRESTSGRNFDTTSGGPFWRRDFERFDFLKIALRQSWITGGDGSLRLIEPALSLHMDRRVGDGLPRHGWRLDASMSLPLQTNGSGRWMATQLEGRAYYRLGEWILLAPRAGYGRSVSLRDPVPKVFRQYLGGAGSVRGYALDSLGPIGADGLASGGLYAGHAGIDLVLMPDKRFSPALFADVGKVWNAPADSEAASISAGAGLVIGTPAGPLRVDIAIPLRRRPQDASFQFYFSLGEVI